MDHDEYELELLDEEDEEEEDQAIDYDVAYFHETKGEFFRWIFVLVWPVVVSILVGCLVSELGHKINELLGFKKYGFADIFNCLMVMGPFGGYIYSNATMVCAPRYKIIASYVMLFFLPVISTLQVGLCSSNLSGKKGEVSPDLNFAGIWITVFVLYQLFFSILTIKVLKKSVVPYDDDANKYEGIWIYLNKILTKKW